MSWSSRTGWSLAGLEAPWRGRPSIHAHLLQHGAGVELPDTERSAYRLTFAAGARDGILGGGGSGDRADRDGGDDAASSNGDSGEGGDGGATGGVGQGERLRTVIDPLTALLESADSANLHQLYAAVCDPPLLDVADALREHVAARLASRFPGRIAAVGRFFAAGADRREAVKFGIVLLGSVAATCLDPGSAAAPIGAPPSHPGAGDRALLETLATHDELTLFAAVALTASAADPERCLFEIAQRVHGWGRVQTVRRFDGTGDREIQAWLLRDGWRCSVPDNDLVLLCAESGNLDDALAAPAFPAIDAALLDGAAGIFTALLGFMPTTLDDYAAAPRAVPAYLRHLAAAGSGGLQHLIAVSAILRFLDPAWEKRSADAWTPEIRRDAEAMGAAIRAWPEWRELIEAGLEAAPAHPAAAPDPAAPATPADPEARAAVWRTFSQADRAARALGLGTRDAHWRWVRAAPLDSRTNYSWHRLLEQSREPALFGEVLDHARAVLPQAEIAAGPDLQRGAGPGAEAHHVLGLLLQDLPRYPAHGAGQAAWAVAAGLRSPVIRNRNLAAAVLTAWPRAQWPLEAADLLRQAIAAEPKADVADRLRAAVEGSERAHAANDASSAGSDSADVDR